MGQAGRVLVVDDEQALASVVASYFRAEGFEVALAHDGPAAVEAARADPPDLVVLDVMLPGFDGLEVCRRIRTFSDCYILLLTARGTEVDKLVGLGVGADDYLVKPFSPRELLARGRAMLRRPRTLTGTISEPAAVRTVHGLTIDPTARIASCEGRPLDLTRTEFDLLDQLTARPRQAFTRRQLIEAVWGEAWVGDEHLVDVHIGHLRRKLGDSATEPRYIRTVRGIGYGMVAR